ncbi:nucleoside 2-deoxyribosyltransferase [Micromonospora sp. NPDC004704]
MKIYIASPLFSEAERHFNLVVDEALRESGLDTHLPQRDGVNVAELAEQGVPEQVIRNRIFVADVAALGGCDLLVLVLDGRVPDEGACVELGIAYARGMPCVGLQTDSRRFDGTDSNNLMIDQALTGGITHSIGELVEHLRTYPAVRPTAVAADAPTRAG